MAAIEPLTSHIEKKDFRFAMDELKRDIWDRFVPDSRQFEDKKTHIFLESFKHQYEMVWRVLTTHMERCVNDLKVDLKSGKYAGMQDDVVLKGSHSYIEYRNALVWVFEQAVASIERDQKILMGLAKLKGDDLYKEELWLAEHSGRSLATVLALVEYVAMTKWYVVDNTTKRQLDAIFSRAGHLNMVIRAARAKKKHWWDHDPMYKRIEHLRKAARGKNEERDKALEFFLHVFRG